MKNLSVAAKIFVLTGIIIFVFSVFILWTFQNTRDNLLTARRTEIRTVAMIEAMGQGNFENRLHLQQSDEVGRLARSMGSFADALQLGILAASLEEISSSMTQIASQIKINAANASQAAKETEALIEGAVERTASGTAIATQTATALDEIVSRVVKVADLVGEIAAASNEQAQGISQITVGINQIDQVTQQNTAGAEQSAAAAEQLSGQAQQLREMLRHFTLEVDEDGGRGDDLAAVGQRPNREIHKRPAPARLL